MKFKVGDRVKIYNKHVAEGEDDILLIEQATIVHKDKYEELFTVCYGENMSKTGYFCYDGTHFCLKEIFMVLA